MRGGIGQRASKGSFIDPVDGLIIDEVGPWATEKHARVSGYIQASSPTRAKYLPPRGRGGATYIELYCGPGRSRIRGTSRIINASPLVAYNAALASGHRFSELHLNDIDDEKAAAVQTRIASLGSAAVIYS